MSRRSFVQQALIDAFLLPVTGLEMRAEHAQIDQGKLTPHQARQQRRKTFAADARQALADGGQNRRLHQRQRHRGGHAENFPLVGQVVATVFIARIDADLLFATEHQHRRAGDDQRPQRQQFFMGAAD